VLAMHSALRPRTSESLARNTTEGSRSAASGLTLILSAVRDRYMADHGVLRMRPEIVPLIVAKSGLIGQPVVAAPAPSRLSRSSSSLVVQAHHLVSITLPSSGRGWLWSSRCRLHPRSCSGTSARDHILQASYRGNCDRVG
jgi:hypothetical protein